MSGHNKWSSIKHKKAIKDAQKANLFTKYARLIEVAARQGGDPETNFALRLAIDKARSVNMPKNNIERAIKRGTGEDKSGAVLEEVTYEAYGPGQISMLIQCITDNKNRTLTEVKTILKKNKGKFVESGGVSWQFEQKGLILLADIPTDQREELEMAIIESGADDYEFLDGNKVAIYTPFNELKEITERLQKNLSNAGLPGKAQESKVIFHPKEKATVAEEIKNDFYALKSLLEENDDVSVIWHNLREK